MGNQQRSLTAVRNVQRLGGDGSARAGLRYSPIPGESRRQEEGVRPQSLPVGLTRFSLQGSLRLNLTQHGKTYQVQTREGLTD